MRSCGDIILPLRHVTAMPGGGHAYFYAAGYTRLMPPSHFNPLRASDRQLSEYGFPTRKQLGRRWYGLMRDFRSVVQPGPYLVEDPAVRNDATPINWAGYYVSGHTYNEVVATWTEPTVVATGCSQDAFAQWVGLGGVNGLHGVYNLAQAGTSFNEFGAHQGWTETIINNSGGAIPAQGFYATPGKGFYDSVLWLNVQQQFAYYMQNESTGKAYLPPFVTDTSPDLSTAEVISERPIVGKLAELSDFQSVPVQDATASWSSGNGGFDNLTNTRMVMEDPPGIVLADTNIIDSGSNFSTQWAACGPYGS